MLNDRKIIQVICPTRVDFTGGFTDVLPFRATQWVSHVNLAIELPTEILLKSQSDDLVIIRDNHSNTVAQVSSSSDIEERFSLIRSALRKFGIEGSINIAIVSRAPSGAGLGTSGAISVALTAALMLFTGKVLPKDILDLAVLAAEIEQESGVLGGLQDQFAAAMGGLNLFRFYGSKYSSKRLNPSDQYLTELEQNLFILYPGGKRRSTDIVTEVMNGYRSRNSTVTNALLSLNSVASKIVEALESEDLQKLSTLFGAVREQQLKLHPRLIDGRNQKIINALKDQGVNGIKLLGGGGAGACLLVICPDSRSKKVIERISDVNSVEIFPVRYAKKGLRVDINHRVPT